MSRGERPPAPEPLAVAVVDNHTHLDSETPGDVEALLAAAAAAGVPRSVQIGCDLPAARWTVAALDRFPQLLGGVALHPNEVPDLVAAGEYEAALAEIRVLAAHPRVRVVGETGLDHFRTPPEQWALQEDAFRDHVRLAKELGLALQIHDRDAHEDVLRVLAEEGAPERTVFHCFSGDAAMARVCGDAGYYLSFAGTVTFKNTDPLREALRAAPRDRVMVETDAPYLTPVPHRGRPNAGYLVPLTVRSMARTLGADLDELCATLTATTESVYGPW
ncbi:TatD DNase family protein [Kineococcus radiotolerans]|uniref:TatD DNase family protein n=1 Tax=Kineococcus radiotolerans TaxID=131568 RepID=A0A7W4XVW6_KINRA|nr:TatD family hydrolase [Kineococcus radiotolerans]MBB2900273.1 TatD DNase family protein [Kineococcus radiotolerans]